MRVSYLMLVTLRDDPAEAEIISHKLLLRGGYIRRISIGIYAYMPLLWKVLKKISSCVREEMAYAGALETLLPQLQPSEIWQRSNRWNDYTKSEGIMFHLEDRQGREIALGPTHEEIITVLASDLLKSYRQLPVTLYQIQTKFRDEIRPRFGLMRSREFIMKDAYSFHSTDSDLVLTYNSIDLAYRRIFKRCGLNVVAVEADSGAIGGAASQEFMVTAEAGEDLIFVSDDHNYAANKEKAVSLPKIPVITKSGICKVISTPNQPSIEELCDAQQIDSSQVVKVLLMLARFTDHSHIPILIILRADQLVNEVKLRNAVRSHLSIQSATLLDVIPITPEQVEEQGLAPLPFGYIGPHLENKVLHGAKTWQTHFLRLIDPTASALTSFTCGANEYNKHMVNMKWGPLVPLHSQVDLRDAEPQDQCIHNPLSRLQVNRGIEVGHIFQLGRKYSSALDAKFTNEKGNQETFWMGCYGIGISRLSQAAVEQHHDTKGICWPLSIAPFEVVIVVANIRDQVQRNLSEALYTVLKNAQVDVLIDERQERAGVKFKDAELIGIPWQIIVGRSASIHKAELIERATLKTIELNASELLQYLLQILESTHMGLLND
uniref:proline--tRNA ligase n=1 Tax=Paulinella micropora TaxID=1928728 RepID=A0A385I1I2_9EUKA|nr:prolyl-tRNA synthetase [Paulinella micropora]AXY63789.1 prolyl-tRNA synthetase [Paulinella micropora]